MSIKLSILILTIPERGDKLQRLMDILRPQLPVDQSVEIIVSKNNSVSNGGPLIGDNRNAALDLAAGEYVCFIDDDDTVPEYYISEILKAIESKPDVVGLKGNYYCGNNKPEVFIHSVEYKEWFTKDGVHYRCPNHLNPVRRELALQAGFTAKNHGEDQDYSLALRPLLKSEVMVDMILYNYLK